MCIPGNVPGLRIFHARSCGCIFDDFVPQRGFFRGAFGAARIFPAFLIRSRARNIFMYSAFGNDFFFSGAENMKKIVILNDGFGPKSFSNQLPGLPLGHPDLNDECNTIFD